MPSILARPQQLLRPLLPMQGVAGLRKLHRFFGPHSRHDPDTSHKRVIIPAFPVSDEDRTRMSLFEEGQALARQDRWGILIEKAQLAEAARLSTPGGFSEALLLILGAQSDLIASTNHALELGQEPDPTGLRDMEHDLANQDSYITACILAITHLRLSRSWLRAATITSEITSEDAAPQIWQHRSAARTLLTPLDAVERDSSCVAAAICALHHDTDSPRSTRVSVDHLCRAFGTLIELDPDSLQHLREFGLVLGRLYAASPGLMEPEAQKSARASADAWGDGGYTMVYLNAATIHPAALNSLDAGRFVTGLHDLVERSQNQHLLNELAAFCAHKMAPGALRSDLSGKARQAHGRIHAEAKWLLQSHLHELHPGLWANQPRARFLGAPRLTRRAVADHGRDIALRAIARIFDEELRQHSSIAFSSAGMYRLPAI